MKKYLHTFMAVLTVMAFATLASAQNTKIYLELGGAKQVIKSDGETEYRSGSTLDIQTGATVSLASTMTLAGGQLRVGSYGMHIATITDRGVINADQFNGIFGLSVATAVITNTGASSLDIGGGLNAGTGNVGIIGTDGRIPALSTTYLADLSGANLTTLTAANISAGSLGGSVIASSIAVNGVYPKAVASGTYSNITLPAANVASGSLGSEVICSSMAASISALLTTVAAGNVTAGTLADTVIASSVGANGVQPGSIVAGAIVNADINADAAITDTKLAQIATTNKVALTALAAGTLDVGVVASSVAANGVRPGSVVAGAIVNDDINAAAAIAKTKLAALDIVNADVNASAGIVDTKLATIATAGKVNASALTGSFPIGVQTYQNANCEALTPAAEGEFCYDTGAHALEISTSTNVGGFAPLTY